jgi:hypothetical protein
LTSDGLLEMGEQTIVAIQRYVARTEGRLAYRQEHGRTLSKTALDQLADLRQRIDNIIDPPASTEALRRDFEELQRRLEGLE